MAIQEVLVSKIFNYTSEPTKKVEGQFWFNPSTNILSRYNGTAWKAITVSSDDVAVLSDGNKISLTNYLNTQIAALAEGIDSKQDKLTKYSENGSVNISDMYVYMTAGDVLTLKGSTSVNLSTDRFSSAEINLSSGNQSITLNSDDDEGTEGSIALDGNITGTGVVTSIGSYDMSSTRKIPTEHAVAEALVAKQDKLNFYSEKGKDYLSEYTEAKLDYVSTIDFRAVNLDGGSNIKLVSTSAADVPGYLTLQANCTTSDTSAKIYLDSGDRSTPASITIDGELKGTAIATSISSSPSDGKVITEKCVAEQFTLIDTAISSKQNTLQTYSEVASNTASIATDGTISLNCPGDISLNSTTKISGSLHVAGGVLYLNNSGLYVDDQDWFAMNDTAINAKQSSTDNTLETSSKTIVGAINEINSAIVNPTTLPTPITDVKTITTTLENLITDTQYANKPGTILINPNIKNTGAILVGEAITDISKAFPIYTDQPVTIAFKNINDFKVAGENAGESFNYIISFGYINQTISTNA